MSVAPTTTPLPVGSKAAWVEFTATITAHQCADVDAPGSSPGYVLTPDDGGPEQWVNAKSDHLMALPQAPSLTLEQITTLVVANTGTCSCIEGYTSRNLIDPMCMWHQAGEGLVEDLCEILTIDGEGN